MKKGISIAVFAALVAVQVVLTASRIKTTGSHESSTGAPGEQTCAQPYCHTDASINDGDDGTNTLTFGNNETAYELGKKYTVTIKVQKAGIEKFGFQVTPLDKKYNNLGTLTITDGTRTKQQSNSVSSNMRYYVTHKAPGTQPTATGENEWSFDWTAPSTDEGPVTFYYTTNCTNNNNQNKGDALYLSSSKIESPLSSSVLEESAVTNWNIYWRVLKGQVVLDYELKNKAQVQVDLYDLQGRNVKSIASQKKERGAHHEGIELGAGIGSGIYIVHLNVDGKALSKKILVY